MSGEGDTRTPGAPRGDGPGGARAQGAAEGQAEALFAFTPARPERGDLPPPDAVESPWDRILLGKYNSRLSIALMAVVALAPVPLGSNRPVFWMILAAVVFALLGVYLGALAVHRIRLRRPAWRMPALSALAVLFLGFAALQTLPIAGWVPSGAGLPGGGAITLDRDGTRIAALRWASYAAFFFLMLQVVDNRMRARRLAWAVFLIVAVHAAYGLISLRFLGDAFHWGPKETGGFVVTGTFVNRNSFATFAGFGAILGFSLLLHEGFRRRALARSRFWMVSVEGLRTATLWVILLLILAALVATGSRMGVASSGAGLILAAILLVRKHAGRSRRTGLVLTLMGALAAVAVFFVFGQVTLDRAIFSAQDGSTRMDLYREVIGLVGQRPLTGFGLDGFALAFEQVHRPPVSPDLVWSRAHSTYLTLWSEMGVIFGSVPLLIVGLVALGLGRVVAARRHDFVLAVAGLGGVTLAALHSLADFSLEMPANVYVFLAILALGLGAARDPREGAAQEAQ